jgi:hypothetical protein
MTKPLRWPDAVTQSFWWLQSPRKWNGTSTFGIPRPTGKSSSRVSLSNHPAEGIELETVVRLGAVHRQIVKLADERKVDLIVMESANPRVQDYLLGTTASHVVAHAKCSVYVVRG